MIHFSKFARSRITFALVIFSALGALSLTVCAEPKNGGVPRAQRHEYHQEIDQLEEIWRDAVLNGNASSMDALLAADYMEITPNGTLQSREQDLANLRSGVIHITTLDVFDRKVRFYGKTALVTCRAEVIGRTAAGDVSGSYRHSRVYVRDAQGKWKIVSFEASRIR